MSLIGQANTSGVAATTTAIAKEVRWRHPNTPKVESFPEGASQDFKAGEIVTLSSNKVAAIATLPAALKVSSAIATSTPVLGVALADASGTTDTAIPVLIADDNLEVLLRIHDAADPSVATASQEQDVGIGDFAPLYRYCGETTSIVQTVVGAAPLSDASDKAMISSKLETQPATAEYAWVWCKFRKTYTDGTSLRVF